MHDQRTADSMVSGLLAVEYLVEKTVVASLEDGVPEQFAITMHARLCQQPHQKYQYHSNRIPFSH